MRKKALSLLLALALCLSLMPAAVFAEEGDEGTSGEPATEPETPEVLDVTLSPADGSTIKVYTGETFTTSVSVANASSDCTFSWSLTQHLYVDWKGSAQNTSNSSTQEWKASFTPGSESIFCYVNGKLVGRIAVEVTKNPNAHNVYFDSNGGYAMMSSQTHVIGDFTLPKNGFGAPTGKEFKCWATSKDGSGPTYQPGETVTLTRNTTFYAIWQDIPGTPSIPSGGGSASDYGSFQKTTQSEAFDRSKYGDMMVGFPRVSLKSPYKESDFEYLWTSGNKNVVGFESLNAPSATTTTDISSGARIYLTGKGTATVTVDLYYKGKFIERLHTINYTVTGEALGLTISADGGKTEFKSGETVSLRVSGGQYGYDWQVLKLLSTGGTTNGGNVKKEADDWSKVTWTAPAVSEKTTFRFLCMPLNSSKWPLQEYTKMFDITVLPASVTIVYDANGGAGSMKSQTITTLGTYNLPTACSFTAPAGKQFKGWSTSPKGEIITKYIFDKPDTTTTFYAIWGEVTNLAVTFDSNGGNKVNPGSINVVVGESYGTLPTPTRSGYAFDGWYTTAEGGDKVTSATKVTATKDHVLYARWAKAIKVYFRAQGGSCSETSRNAAAGQPYGVLPTPTRSGYTFDGWYTAAEGGDKGTSSTIIPNVSNGACYLYAHWIRQITVSFDNNGGGYMSRITVTPGRPYGILPTPTREGYTFDGWYTSRSGGSRVTSSTTVTETYNHTLYAHWIEADGKLSVSPDKVSFDKLQEGYAQPAAQTVTVKNTGKGEVTLSQPTASNFELGRLSPSTLAANASATFTVRPKAGLKAGTYSENIVIKSSDGKTSTSLTVSVVVEAGTTDAPSSSFTDVQPGAFYYDAVSWAVEKGITSGTSATTFSPGEICTRGQVVTFLWRAAGRPEPSSFANSFADMQNPSAYCYDAVLWAVEKGVTSGTSSNIFSPEDTCTRGQVVTFLWRAAGRPEPKASSSSFGDVQDSGTYYYKAVLWAVENGITTGTSETAFSPDATCTRSQIVMFLHRAYQ